MTPVTPAELDRLLALADAATPGPWRVVNGLVVTEVRGPFDRFGVINDDDARPADAAFIAAANPDTIRALVAAVREPLEVERLAKAAYEDRPPTGRRPVPWTPVLRREWTAWARRMAAALEPKP